MMSGSPDPAEARLRALLAEREAEVAALRAHITAIEASRDRLREALAASRAMNRYPGRYTLFNQPPLEVVARLGAALVALTPEDEATPDAPAPRGDHGA